jgi:hypothetical protein
MPFDRPEDTPSAKTLSELGARVAQKSLNSLDRQLDLLDKDPSLLPARIAAIAALASASAAGIGATLDED